MLCLCDIGFGGVIESGIGSGLYIGEMGKGIRLLAVTRKRRC